MLKPQRVDILICSGQKRDHNGKYRVIFFFFQIQCILPFVLHLSFSEKESNPQSKGETYGALDVHIAMLQ